MTHHTATLNPRVPYLSADLIQQQVRQALAEDIGSGDVTATLLSPTQLAQATVTCRESAVVCGVAWFNEVFAQLDKTIDIQWHVNEGGYIQAKQKLCSLSGHAPSLLTGERTALNLLQTLSGTATQTRLYVDAVAGTQTRILDTRKTLPGLRLAQKYAVRCGGGHNHRLGLYDRVLIKENHITSTGSIQAAVAMTRSMHPHIPIEVEVETLDELRLALNSKVDHILLDNMSPDKIREAVEITDKRAILEASGGITLENIHQFAALGIDEISVGALTKHLQSIDLSMGFT